MSELSEKISQKEGIEGVVIVFDDGSMFKLKTKWYTSQGKGASDLLCQVNNISLCCFFPL